MYNVKRRNQDEINHTTQDVQLTACIGNAVQPHPRLGEHRLCRRQRRHRKRSENRYHLCRAQLRPELRHSLCQARRQHYHQGTQRRRGIYQVHRSDRQGHAGSRRLFRDLFQQNLSAPGCHPRHGRSVGQGQPRRRQALHRRQSQYGQQQAGADPRRDRKLHAQQRADRRR